VASLDRVPQALWSELASAPHRLLLLDYDGTLAPFRADRREAVPLPEALRLVTLIAERPSTTVAIVSGRPILELDPLLGEAGRRLMVVGEHGWELRPPGGPILQHPLPVEAWLGLDRAAQAAAARGWEELLESKRTAVMLHTRGLHDREAAAWFERECRELWGADAAAAGLRLSEVDGGVELRVPGRDKGTAVREILLSSPAGAYPVYLGDDATDEDAFEAVRERGLGIRVGPEERPSRAAGRIVSCEEVPLFLVEWLAQPVGAGPTEGDRP